MRRSVYAYVRRRSASDVHPGDVDGWLEYEVSGTEVDLAQARAKRFGTVPRTACRFHMRGNCDGIRHQKDSAGTMRLRFSVSLTACLQALFYGIEV